MGYALHLTLLSDASFGRGDGVAGMIDAEVEYDTATGLPFVRGRTLKGLLVEECAGILYGLERSSIPQETLQSLRRAARFLFGQAGSTHDDTARMHVGAARLPEALIRAVRYEIDETRRLRPEAVLESLSTVRNQTSLDRFGAPEEGSLRAMRVVLRRTEFTAPLEFDEAPGEESLALLAACVSALRRGGTGRNRGRGRLCAQLVAAESDVTDRYIEAFATSLKGGTR